MASYPVRGISPWDLELKVYIDDLVGTALDPDAILELLPEFLPETNGALGGGNNDTVALQATFDAAYDAGGGTVVLSDRYGWTGDLKHRGAITVRGVSVAKVLIADDDMDRGLVALDATSRYVYGQWAGADVPSGDDNPGGLYDLVINGDNVGGATEALFLWQGVDGYIQNCRIIKSAGNAVMIDGTQNSTMEGCLVGESAGAAFAFSRIGDTGQGAGSVKINNTYGATSGMMIYADSDPANFWAHDVFFDKCLFENYTAGNGMAHLRAGEFQFIKCIFTNSNIGSPLPENDCLFLIEQDVWPTIPTQVVFDGCYFNGTAGLPHLVRTVTDPAGVGNIVRFYGKSYFNNGDFVVGLDAGGPFTSQVTIDGDAFRTGISPPEWYEAINGAWMFNIQRRTAMPMRWEMPTDPGGFLPDPISVRRETDTEDRLRISRDGKHLWGDGTSPFATQGSLEYVAAADEMQMGNRWRFMNSWALNGIVTFVSGVGQAVAISAAETSAPQALLVFQFNGVSANLTITGGESGSQFQIIAYAPATTGNRINWPSNIHFRGDAPQPGDSGDQSIVVDLVKVGTDWYGKGSASKAAQVVRVTVPVADQAVVLPSGWKSALVRGQGPGGGGGSGRRGAAGSLRIAGGAGSGGGYSEWTLTPADIPGVTTLYVDLAAPGVGGAAVTANDTNGNAGVPAGTLTQIKTAPGAGTIATVLLEARGGDSGSGGTSAGAAVGGGARIGRWFSGGGASAPATGASATPGPAQSGPQGGGSGGGITAADVPSAGGNGGYPAGRLAASAPAGGAINTAGANGANPPALGYGQSGAGGGASITGPAGAGGNGGTGAGGGGGGASLNGFNSGKGGDGGPGFVEIVFSF